MVIWDEKHYRHKRVDIPESSGKRKPHRKASTVSIDNSIRWARFAKPHQRAYLKVQAESDAEKLKPFAAADGTVLDVLKRLDECDDKKELHSSIDELDTLARDGKSDAVKAYAAAVAVSATTLRLLKDDKSIDIHAAAFPGTMTDMHGMFIGVFTRPPAAGDAGKNPLAYKALKATVFRCWTRKDESVSAEMLKGCGYTKQDKPKESELSNMEEALAIRAVIYKIVLCSLLGNYVFCDPASRPTLEQRKLLVTALDSRASSTPQGIAIAKGLFERAPNLQKLAMREHQISLVDNDEALMDYAQSVQDWTKMRTHTIENMNAVRRLVCKWVEQVDENKGDALFASIAAINMTERFNCTYKKPAGPVLTAITAHIGKHAEEKALMERDSDSDDDDDDDGPAGGAEDEDGVDWTAIMEMVNDFKHKKNNKNEEFTAETGMHLDHCRRMITAVRALPLSVSQEELYTSGHLSTILKMCGAPPGAIAEVELMAKQHLGNTNLRTKEPTTLTKRAWTMQTAKLRLMYPYTMRLLEALRAIWGRRMITRQPLLRRDLVMQSKALAEWFDVPPEEASVPSEACVLVFCEVCRQIYTIVNQHRSNLKQVYRNGLRDALLDTEKDQLRCKSSNSFGHEHCQDRPLRQMPLLGFEIGWPTGETFRICSQYKCGQTFVVDLAHNIYTERGLACNECSMTLIEQQFKQRHDSILAQYTQPSYACAYPKCSRVCTSVRSMWCFGNVWICPSTKHKRGFLIKYLKANLPGHVLRNLTGDKEHDQIIFKAMRQFKAEQAERDKVGINARNRTHKAQESRDRQKQRR